MLKSSMSYQASDSTVNLNDMTQNSDKNQKVVEEELIRSNTSEKVFYFFHILTF